MAMLSIFLRWFSTVQLRNCKICRLTECAQESTGEWQKTKVWLVLTSSIQEVFSCRSHSVRLSPHTVTPERWDSFPLVLYTLCNLRKININLVSSSLLNSPIVKKTKLSSSYYSWKNLINLKYCDTFALYDDGSAMNMYTDKFRYRILLQFVWTLYFNAMGICFGWFQNVYNALQCLLISGYTWIQQ